MNSSYNSYGILKPVLCSSPIRPIGPGCTFAGIITDMYREQGSPILNPEWAHITGGGPHSDVFELSEGVLTQEQYQRIIARERGKKLQSMLLGLAALGLAGGLVTFAVIRLRKGRKS